MDFHPLQVHLQEDPRPRLARSPELALWVRLCRALEGLAFVLAERQRRRDVAWAPLRRPRLLVGSYWEAPSTVGLSRLWFSELSLSRLALPYSRGFVSAR